jgi:hypothetical protein
MRSQFNGLPKSALDVRLAILDRGALWVGLPELLDYCWSIGIPVVFLARFPNGAKKMQGLSAMHQGRPVIVLSRKAAHAAWLLFVLAHELGHIACGHLSEDGVLLDQDVDKNERDVEEDQANAFAIELLTGEPEFRVFTSGRWPNAKDLARIARQLGTKHRIDPGHVVLKYAHTMGSGFWPVANAALKLLESKADAPALIRDTLAGNLDWASLPRDSSKFLMRVSTAEPGR